MWCQQDVCCVGIEDENHTSSYAVERCGHITSSVFNVLCRCSVVKVLSTAQLGKLLYVPIKLDKASCLPAGKCAPLRSYIGILYR